VGFGCSDVAVDDSGNVYVASSAFIYKYSGGLSGSKTTLVSSGLNNSRGLALDVARNLYIADLGNKAIKEWTAASSNVTTLVASGLSDPSRVAVSGSGNVYISDFSNRAIYKWTATDSNVVTLVSSGLSYPVGVAVDNVGNVYFADYSNNVIDEMVCAYVDPTAKTETFSAGNDVLPVVLPATANLTGALAPVSDSAWLTITGVSNGVVSFAFTKNTGSSSRTANITLLGQAISIMQSAVAPPIFSGAAMLGDGTFNFTWSAVSNQTYQLQYTTNLTAPNWIDLGSPVTASSNSVSTTDAAAADDQRFYRVRLWP
jgi:sugar lactone lactonase YvrE